MDEIEIMSLKKVTNEKGFLMEVQRNDDAEFPGFGQAYITATNPGVIKAWYRHRKQIDQITLIRGELLLVLYDTRENSISFNQIKEIYIVEKDPLLVQIPPGVWHGFKTLSNDPAILLHMNNIAYDFENKDEDRLLPNDKTIPYKWERKL
ncbi:dTDP-4-dehydrorhamnose 3,5-epimerase family protein [Chengkuizengella sp. SCS-71B]|uniref:dTDP-4-dehydrorhamnose 3,5-epimerase family protein n=1 Tax=Chengkuizengella sp. SCS-71B TaxID=3115290 RepID=UPI0032C23507